MVTAVRPSELETEGSCELEKVIERQILGTVERFPEQFVRIREAPDEGTIRNHGDFSFDRPF